MEWISVKNKRPPVHCLLFLFNGKKEVTYGSVYDWEIESDEYVWINDMDRETNETATHWMPMILPNPLPLPKPPKEI